MGNRRFFLERGFEDVSEVIDLVYNCAEFWQVDPELELSRSIDVILEHNSQAWRLTQSRKNDG